MRRGRLSNDERSQVLYFLGRHAQQMYVHNLKMKLRTYRRFMYALKFAPDIDSFQNHYWTETRSSEDERILNYLEFGTGLNGSSRRRIIEPVSKKFLKFKGRGKWSGKTFFKKYVRGVKPGFMFTKTVEYMTHNNERLKTMARMRLGI